MWKEKNGIGREREKGGERDEAIGQFHLSDLD